MDLKDNIVLVYIVLYDGVLLEWPRLGELGLENNKNVALHAVWNQRHWTANYPGPFKVSAKFLQHWWCGKKQVSQRHARKGGVFRWGVWVVCWGRGQVLLPCYHTWQKAWNVKRSKVSHEEHQEQNLKAKSIFFLKIFDVRDFTDVAVLRKREYQNRCFPYGSKLLYVTVAASRPQSANTINYTSRLCCPKNAFLV